MKHFIFFLFSRIGQFYPNLTTSFSHDQCPPFWRNNKIKIKLLNMTEDGYMENIKTSAYVAIGLDVFLGIAFFTLIWKKTNLQAVFMKAKDEYGPWWMLCGCSLWLCGCRVGPIRCITGFGKVRFIIVTIILGFGLPLLDTISGEFKPRHFF